MSGNRGTPVNKAEFEERLDALGETWLAWFAGWLCADGSILDVEGGRPRIRFTITDLDPLDQFSEQLGGAVNGPYPPSGLGVKNRYTWSISGWRAVAVLRRVRPWLSIRYGRRADALLGYESRDHYGQKLTPQDVESIRAALATGGHGTGRRLARQYGVSDAAISAIKSERIWGAA